MRNSQGREWALVLNQSHEPQPRVHGSCVGQSTYFLRTLGLLGLQVMGINFKVPIARKPNDENCKPALMDFMHVSQRGGVTDTKRSKKSEKFTAKLCTLPPCEVSWFFPDVCPRGKSSCQAEVLDLSCILSVARQNEKRAGHNSCQVWFVLNLHWFFKLRSGT